MKKYNLIRFVCGVAMVLILLLVTAYASVIPVKDMQFISENFIVILMENGNLYSADSIDAQESKLLATDVSEFVQLESGGGVFSYNNGLILYNNGDIASYSFYNDKIEIDERNSADAKYICDFYVDLDDVLFVDKNNTLYFIKYDTNNNYSYVRIFENVKEVCEGGYNSIYVITTNNDLYFLSKSNGGYDFSLVLGDVIEMKVNNRHWESLILRANGDLYYQEQSGKNDKPLLRIGQNVSTLSHTSVLSGGGTVDYIDSEGNVYYCDISGDSIKKKEKYQSDVKYVFERNGIRYTISNDRRLVKFGNGSHTPDWRGAKDDYHYDYWCFFEKYLPSGYFITSSAFEANTGIIYGFTSRFDVSDVVKACSKNHSHLFLKSNGELWGAFSDDASLYDVQQYQAFMTSFCQKPLKIMINNTEISLNAKVQIINDRSMYPFRECLEAMGATVLWDSENQIAIGEHNGNVIEFPIGKSEYILNGKKYSMDIASYIDSGLGRTYIPIRFAAEGLGFIVDWIDSATESVISIYE